MDAPSLPTPYHPLVPAGQELRQEAETRREQLQADHLALKRQHEALQGDHEALLQRQEEDRQANVVLHELNAHLVRLFQE